MSRPDDRSDKALFDFLTNADFKVNLKSDYDELQASVKNGQWKAAHVLAGSIIEAILIDYLIAVNHDGKPEAELLKWDMTKLIPAGKAAGILTDKTASLCVVIKDYRNLIHPGRVLRLQETVTEDGAAVALALMKMVAKDIGKKKAEVYGYTAEQLIAKLEIDPACTSYLPFIVGDMKPAEKRRLLLEVLPARNYDFTVNSEILEDSPPNLIQDTKAAFGRCFRMVWDQMDLHVQKEVLHQYISILKEHTAIYRECYEESFFRFTDLEWTASVHEVELVKGHLLSRLENGYDPNISVVAAGIGKYITMQDVITKAARGLMTALTNCDDWDKAECFNWFAREHANLAFDVREEFNKEMDGLARAQSVDLSDLSASLKRLMDKSSPF